MFPIMVIAIGLAVLAFGRRLAVLGAAVGALLGIGLLSLFPGSATPLSIILIPGLLAVLGGLLAGLTKGIVNIVLIVLGALAGASIVLGFLDLFQIDSILLGWLFAVVGGVIGVIMVQRFKDLAMTILAGLVGALLVTRGLTDWMAFLSGFLGTIIVVVLAGAGIAYQGGFIGGNKTAG
jgi:hypothetical protein